MNQLLDLSIMLTEPPDDSPPEAIACIVLRCDALGLVYMGDLLYDPLTQKEYDDLHWYLEEYWKWPYEQFLRRGRQAVDLLADLGERLYKAVFGSINAREIFIKWQKQPAIQHQISIVSEIPKVFSLPWELLHDLHGFLALRQDHPPSIVRRLPHSEEFPILTPFNPPLRILLVTARPEGSDFVDARSIARELLDEVQTKIEERIIELEFLRPPTLSALQARLRDRERPQVHIFHFDGHGAFKDGHGILLFEKGVDQVSYVKADDLAKVLRGSGIQLAVLTACQSAMSGVDDIFSSVAAQLIKSGIGAVVAMSSSVLVASATRYVEAFYRALAAGTSAPIAHTQAQRALYNDPRRHLLLRRRNEEEQPIEIYDWWLPHFYQQRSVSLQPGEVKHEYRKTQQIPSLPRLNSEMPPEPRYGFIGRARELLQIERLLMRRKIVMICGFGGGGKTILAREAADWLTQTRMYDGACFVSFEHGGVTALLSSLGIYLEIYDSSYNPNDKAAALEKLKPILNTGRILVIADNLESILPRGNTPLNTERQTQLWDVLLELSGIGAGILLTSRDALFDDGRFTSEKQVAYLTLGGLYPEDAYTLASRLLDDLKIDRKHVPPFELHALLAQLDHHPLAIQLVLPTLRDLSLAEVMTDFAALLPRFVDNRETGHNRSLLASLDYSLQRLSEEQLSLLSRLVPFEGRVVEEVMLRITGIPGSEWEKLRTELEQAGLLTTEQGHEGIRSLFLRFHPVLIPYVRSFRDIEDEQLNIRYVEAYLSILQIMRFKHQSGTQQNQTRAWAKWELPNFLRAFQILIKIGTPEAITSAADNVDFFLTLFGMTQERDKLRQQVAEKLVVTDVGKMGELTEEQFQYEDMLGEEEYKKGEIKAAFTRYMALLARIESLPEGVPFGRGSYTHCITLRRLSTCLMANGQLDEAENRLREAYRIIEVLMNDRAEQYPDRVAIEDPIFYLAFLLHIDIGAMFVTRGKYEEAQEILEEVLDLLRESGDRRSQAVVLTQLGLIAQQQGDLVKAQMLTYEALKIFQALQELSLVASTLVYLGHITGELGEWAEAEFCYRDSLMISEQLGDEAQVAVTCGHLANIAEKASRPDDAEGWYARAVTLDKRIWPNNKVHAIHLTGFAELLINEIRANRTLMTRLAEATGYAEQALAINENRDAEISEKLLGILADIADLDGRVTVAQDYRCRQREVFASLINQRALIDQHYGKLINAVVAVTKGDTHARAFVEKVLQQAEADNWPIAEPIYRIWAGERDWHALAEKLHPLSALLVLRILETIEESAP